MTLLDGHAPTTGAWPFRTRLDELCQVGVELAQDQVELYNRAILRQPVDELDDWLWAMTIEVIPCPERDLEGTCPLEVWLPDEHCEVFTPAPLVVPRVVRVDWSQATALDVLDPGWRRFPSLPCQPMDEDHELQPVQAIRLWNLWPVNHGEALDVSDAYRAARYSEWLTAFNAYLPIYEGAVHPCTLHKDDPCEWPADEPAYWQSNEICELARDLEIGLRAQVVYQDEDGLEHWLHPGPRFFELPWPLNETWELLQSFSQRNAWASLDAYDTPGLRDDERRYSPWLWSS